MNTLVRIVEAIGVLILLGVGAWVVVDALLQVIRSFAS